MTTEPSDAELATDMEALAQELDSYSRHESAQIVRLAAQRLKSKAEISAAWKEATIAWACCASIHREYAKGKDALFTTRQVDYVKAEERCRAALKAALSAHEKEG